MPWRAASRKQNLLLNLFPAISYLIILKQIRSAPDPDNIDVHGNQLGLLRSSKCFTMSNTMTCTTCHNPHENERGKTALFSSTVHHMSHNTAHQNTCKMTASIGPSIARNCIDCHMPLKASKIHHVNCFRVIPTRLRL